MPKYIDAEILEGKIDEMQNKLLTNDDSLWDINKPYYAGLAMARGFLNDIPTSDVEEVRHAKWIYEGHSEVRGHVFECSVCGRWGFTNAPKHVVGEYPYCHCGAKMESVEGLEED